MSPWALSLLLTVTFSGVCHCEQICNYDDLLQNLSLSDSPGSRVRPVKDWRTPSIVLLDMFLYTVISLDTSMQIITTFVWFTMVWDNEFVSWNPDDFCGIKRLYVSSDYFWKPDVYIDEMTEDDQSSPVIPYCFIYYNGSIVYAVPLRIISSCNLDIYKFPFDTQTCSLSFGSYVHTVDDIVMLPSSNSSMVSSTSKEIFASRGDWSLLDITVVNETYENEGDLYNQVIYKISIKRTPTVFIINLIAPACLLVILDIFGMFIPIESADRINFKITVVLGFSVLLLILNDLLPSSSSTPVLGIFCIICLSTMVLSIVGCIGTSYMLSISAAQPNVSPWIRTWVLRRLACVLCYKRITLKEEEVTVVAVAENNLSEDDKISEKDILEKSKESRRETNGSLEVKMLNMLMSEILKIHQDLTISKNENTTMSEWHMAALVVDRLIVIVYIIALITTFVVVVALWAT
ncbi:5-hydroxytryptamine receptor 3A-like [Discoglossus pictus]